MNYLGADRLAQEKLRLNELWEELGASDAEKNQFYRKVLLSNSSSTAAKLCQAEVVQMRQRLPIMQMQMRVDQIQHRLDTIHACP